MTVRAEAGTIGTGEQDAAVVLSVDGPIANIRLNRTGKLNAIDVAVST